DIPSNPRIAYHSSRSKWLVGVEKRPETWRAIVREARVVMTASPTDDHASAERRIQALTKELAEASRQQAATSEILRVISSSPTESHRVFQEIAASAARLCDAYDAGVLQRDGDHLRVVGHCGPMLLVGPVGQGKLPLTRGSLIGRVVLDRQTLHVSTLMAVKLPVNLAFTPYWQSRSCALGKQSA